VNYADFKDTIEFSPGLDGVPPSTALPVAQKKTANKRRALLIDQRLKYAIRSLESTTFTTRLKKSIFVATCNA
jgi:hypothetical protein